MLLEPDHVLVLVLLELSSNLGVGDNVEDLLSRVRQLRVLLLDLGLSSLEVWWSRKDEAGRTSGQLSSLLSRRPPFHTRTRARTEGAGLSRVDLLEELAHVVDHVGLLDELVLGGGD